MIKNLFKAAAEQKLLAELKTFPAFRAYVDKLKTARDKAYQDTLTCAVRDLPDRRAYLRALEDLLAITSTP